METAEAQIELDPVFLSRHYTDNELDVAAGSHQQEELLVLRERSFTSLLMQELVQFLATSSLSKSLLHNTAELPLNLQRHLVDPRWAAVARAHPQAFQRAQGSLLHTAAVLLPLPCVYPWPMTGHCIRHSFAELLSTSATEEVGEGSRQALS